MATYLDVIKSHTATAQLANTVLDRAKGFDGEFVFDPEHTEDHGIGNIGEFVDLDDRLVFVPTDSSISYPDNDNNYTIANRVEEHVAKPLADILNLSPMVIAKILPIYSAAMDWYANEEAINQYCKDNIEPPIKLRQLAWQTIDALRNAIDKSLLP